MHVAVIGSGTSSKVLPEHLRELGTAELEPRLVNPRLSAFAFTPYERLIVDLGYVDAAQRAEREGAAAVLVNSFADYGLEAMRAALGVPVIGAGEATLIAAARGGRPFAIVTVWPRSLAHLYDERLRTLALAEQCVAIRYFSGEEELERVGAESGVMARMHRGDSSLIAALREECELAVSQQGAECIVLGCTCMGPIGPALEASVSVPVLESSTVGLRAAFSEVRHRRPPPLRESAGRRDLVPALVDAWFREGGVTPPLADGDCPVCVVGEPVQRSTGEPARG
jgi:allantoin racemase